jgi:glycerol-3-phosphate acyltransferase PlsY
MIYILISGLAYLLGSIPSAFLVVKLATGKNILEYGTGNVGTMNTHRATNNKFLTFVVLICDLLKGYLAYFLAMFLANQYSSDVVLAITIAGFFVVLGHNYSVFLRFKGGKGLATGAGFFWGVNPVLDLVWIIGFLLVTAVSKYMVLGQMLASLILMGFAVISGQQYVWSILGIGALVCIRHWPRMKNVLDGTEPKMYYKVRETDQNSHKSKSKNT